MKKISTFYRKDPTDLGRVIDEIDPQNLWVVFEDHTATQKHDGTASAVMDGKLYKRYDVKLKKSTQLKKLGYYTDVLEIGQEVVKISGKKFSDNDKVATIIAFDKHPHTNEKAAIINSGDTIDLRQLRPIGIKFDDKYYKDIPKGAIACQEPDNISGHWPHWIECDRNNPSDKFHFEAFDKSVFEDGTYELCGEKVQGNPENITGHELIKHGSVVLDIKDYTFEGIKKYLETADIEGIVFHNKEDDRMCKIRKSDFGIKREK